MEGQCPHCKTEIEVHAKRWNGFTNCPKCQQRIFVDFDMIVMEDFSEWDIYKLHPVTEQTSGDEFESKMINARQR